MNLGYLADVSVFPSYEPYEDILLVWSCLALIECCHSDLIAVEEVVKDPRTLTSGGTKVHKVIQDK